MARRRRSRSRARQSRNFETKTVDYGGGYGGKARSYKGFFLESQLAQVDQFMSLASQELGNDYNMEMTRLGVLQDELARIDDLIADWHKTETDAVVKAGEAAVANKMTVAKYNLDVGKARAAVGNRRAINSLNAAKYGASQADLPEDVSKIISSLNDPTSQYGWNTTEGAAAVMSGAMDLVDLSQIRSLAPVQKVRAAMDLYGVLNTRMMEGKVDKSRLQVERKALKGLVARETGVNVNQMTEAGYARLRNTVIKQSKKEFGSGGSTKGMDFIDAREPEEGKKDAPTMEKQRSAILKMWMNRKGELEDELEERPDAPVYEDVRERAREMYDPSADPKEATRRYDELQEGRDLQQKAEEAIQAIPADQRILMQVARQAQKNRSKVGKGDSSVVGALLTNTQAEGDAAEFMIDAMKKGHLTMDEVVGYATKIAQADNIEGSPESIVESRDRMLTRAMQSLYASYEETLPGSEYKPVFGQIDDDEVEDDDVVAKKAAGLTQKAIEEMEKEPSGGAGVSYEGQ